MKTKLTCLAVLSVLAGAVTTAQAQYPCGCCMPGCMPIVTVPPPVPVMPYGYGGYGGNGYGGAGYGGGAPGIYAPPPVPPYQGMLVAPVNNGPAGFPQHPYARSPRDFFMYYDRDNNGNRP